MKLQTLRIKNYRNFKDSGNIPYHSLTIFVGNNGSGKTSTIDALDLLLNGRSTAKPTPNGQVNQETPTEIEGVFKVNGDESGAAEYSLDGELTLKYSYNHADGTTDYKVKCNRYTNDAFNTYRQLGATELKDFVSSLGMRPAPTKVLNHGLVANYLEQETPPTTLGYKPIDWKDIAPILPILQRYSSSDYSQPVSIVSKTLSTIYRRHFYQVDEQTGKETLKQNFTATRDEIEADLNQNIHTQLKTHLSNQMVGVDSVSGTFDIDFARGFSLSDIVVAFEGGERKAISQLSEGHRKKATLAVLEWDASVASEGDRSVIKAYDEPDANLDFTAQRRLYGIINNDVMNNQNNSAIICTHSLLLIDRAPAKCINRMAQDDEGAAKVESLSGDDDSEIREFLSQVAEVSGFRNSTIFYEKAYFIVEGESEEASIGMLYKTYTGKTMADDGIALINLGTNGQWSRALKFLNAHRSKSTVMLLDADTQLPNSDCQVTTEKLQEAGFDSEFLSNNCYFIGTKEFEDTYSDSDLRAVANNQFPKSNGSQWSENDFRAIRADPKFSSALSTLLSKEHGARVSKPMIAQRMAEHYDKNAIFNNTVLKDAFEKLNEIVSQL